MLKLRAVRSESPTQPKLKSTRGTQHPRGASLLNMNSLLMLKADGLDEAIIGVGSSFGRRDVLIYNTEKIFYILMGRGMTHEEAIEYFDFNIIGSYNGDGMPIFMYE